MDPGMMPPIIPHRNYMGSGQDSVDGLKYRLGGEDIIRSMVDMLKGAVRDNYGRVTSYDENLRMMNDKGIYQVEFFVRGAISKITHLTRYINEDRINTHMKEHAKNLAFNITLNVRTWEIKNKDFVQYMVEKAIYESMLRSNDGFENNNISKSWLVSENIDTNRQMQTGGMFGRLFNWGGGGKSYGNN